MGLPKEARYIADWSPSGGFSYHAFLQAKEFENSVRFAIDDQTKQLIGSNKQISTQGFEILKDSLRQGGSTISRDIANLQQSMKADSAEVSAVIRWGFTTLTVGIQQMNDNLAEIKRLIANPTATWACERFDKARDEYQRGLYEEALRSVTQAIDGYGSNPGWDSEFRFHYLLGRIRLGGWLGTFKNISRAVVDPKAAEAAFLNAARYHRQDTYYAEAERAQAVLLAGRAAFLQSEFDRAISHTEQAFRHIAPAWHKLEAAARYQHAKYLSACGSDDARATASLITAFENELNIIIEAAGDPDLLSRRTVVRDALGEITTKLRDRYTALQSNCDDSLDRFRRFSFRGTSAETLLREELTDIAQSRRALVKEAEPGGPLDFDSAIKMAKLILPRFEPLPSLFKKRFAEGSRRKWKGLSETKAAENARAKAVRCEAIHREAQEATQRALAKVEGKGGSEGWRNLRVGCAVFILLGVGSATFLNIAMSQFTPPLVMYWGTNFVFALVLLN